MKDFFFVSGLPRSGSTLLMNILGQHPDIYVTPTSGCHEVLWTTRNNWNTFQEHQNDPIAKSSESIRRVLKGILNCYHDTDKNIIIDKHRSWLLSIELLEFILDSKAKIIVPVRNVTDILASFEKLYRKNAHLQNIPGDFLSSQTTEGRCDYWASKNGELGIAYSRLKDALQRGLGDRLLIVDYDILCRSPKNTMSQVWNFLEVPQPIHDFDNVEQITQEEDSNIIYGKDLHKIRRVVEPNISDPLSILGKNVIEKFKFTEFWK